MTHQNLPSDPFWMYGLQCFCLDCGMKPSQSPQSSKMAISPHLDTMLERAPPNDSPKSSSPSTIRSTNAHTPQPPEMQLASMVEMILPPPRPRIAPAALDPVTIKTQHPTNPDYTPALKTVQGPLPSLQRPIAVKPYRDFTQYVQLAPDRLRDPRGRMLLDHLHAAAMRESLRPAPTPSPPPTFNINVNVEPRAVFDLRTDTRIDLDVVERLNKLLKPNYTLPVVPGSGTWWALKTVAQRQKVSAQEALKVPELRHPKPRWQSKG